MDRSGRAIELEAADRGSSESGVTGLSAKRTVLFRLAIATR
jgi:hypothetical protein